MKKGFRKIGAVLLTFAMALAMNSTVFAAASLTGGEVGGFTNPDAPVSQQKTINIQKELTVYNVDETSINAPTISYTYAITSGAAGVNVTDATTDHANSTPVTVQTKAGVTPNLVTLTGTSPNTIAWAPTDPALSATSAGAPNYKDLTIDFSNVVFGAAGVYRYVITETAPAYAASGVTEFGVADPANDSINSHVRYLDVYVRPAATFTDGSIADDWDIYGYVCMLESEEITDAGDTATTGAVKTNGFVAGTNDGTAYLADSYYTYNVTVSKTVTNDNYAKATHAFPFTVIFTNATVTNAVDISSTTTGTATGFTDPAFAALSAGTTKGIVSLKDSSSVKYIGIPNGTQIEVYETNDMAGVTYQVTTTVDGTTSTADDTIDAAVISGTAPTTAVAQGSPKGNYESTKASFTPGANADDDVSHTIAVDNNLQLISPTGFVVRFAPYMLVLLGGILLIAIGLVIYNKTNKKETA